MRGTILGSEWQEVAKKKKTKLALIDHTFTGVERDNKRNKEIEYASW